MEIIDEEEYTVRIVKVKDCEENIAKVIEFYARYKWDFCDRYFVHEQNPSQSYYSLKFTRS